MAKHIVLILFILASCSTNNSWVCAEGDCENGEGTRAWKGNGIEKGHWVNGKLNGKGFRSFGANSKFADDTYSGDFKDNKYHGHGTYYDKSEDAKYVGEWKEGKANGKGICKWGNDSKYPNRYYNGTWKNGLMHGYGTKFWGISEVDEYTNNKYVGEWKNDMMDGFGKYEWADGCYYEGAWKNDKQNGSGIFITKDRKVIEGYWVNGYCEDLVEKIGHR